MVLKALLGVTKPSSSVDVFETGYLDDVEVDVSHEVSGGGIGGLEAVEEHVVAGAMRLAVERIVGEVVPAGEGAHFGGTQVVRTAAAVQATIRAQVVVVRGYVARTAPFCA